KVGPGVARAPLAPPHPRLVMVGAEQGLQPVLLAGPGERQPLLPGDVLLALDHQADPHAALLVGSGCLPDVTMPAMPRAHGDGVELEYETVGDPAGRALLLV